MDAVDGPGLALLLIASSEAASRISGLLEAEASANFSISVADGDALDRDCLSGVDLLLYHSVAADDLSGFAQWRARQHYLPVVLVSDDPVTAAQRDALALPADEHVCLSDPDAAKQLRSAIRSAVRAWRMHDQFREILEQSPDGVVVVNGESRVLYANPAAIALFKRRENEFIGSTFRVPITTEPVSEVHLEEDRTAEMRVVSVDWLGATAHLATLRDITDRKRAENALTHAADHDSLSGLLNRARFQRDLEKLIESARLRRVRLAVYFIDLDNFKGINDEHGHDAGDEVLRAVAGRLKSAMRNGSLVGRLGGDEFIVANWDVAPGHESGIANRYLTELAKVIQRDGRGLRLTASVGVATYPESASTAHALITAADSAMYVAKRDGKHCYRLYAKAEGDAMARRRRLESDVIYAMTRNEMRLEYQPMVSGMAGDSSFMLEALLRWDHPLYPELTPREFIGLAETSGMVGPVGDWVLVQVCRQLELWRSHPLLKTRLRGASMNVSPLQLLSMRFAVMVERLLKEARVEPSQLWLELNAAALLVHRDECLPALRRLRDFGVTIVLDDFGSSSASLGHLSELPVDALKLNANLLAGSGASEKKQEILRSVMALSRSLSLKVVAEGVESAEQLDWAWQAPCDMVQGFEIARPMPAGDVETFAAVFGREQAHE